MGAAIPFAIAAFEGAAAVAGAVQLGAQLGGLALTVAGAATGNKTLSTIGMGLSTVGAVGALANRTVNTNSAAQPSGLGGANKTGVTGLDSNPLAGGKGILNAANSAGSKLAGGNVSSALWNGNQGDVLSSGRNAGAGSAGQNARDFVSQNAGQNPDPNPNPNPNPNPRFDSAGNVIANMVGSAGDLYAQTRGMQSNEDMQDQRQEFAQREIDRKQRNLNDFGGAENDVRSRFGGRNGLLRRR